MLVSASTTQRPSLAPEFLARILAPYQPTRTDYLRSASVVTAALGAVVEGDAADADVSEGSTPLFTVSGQFSIPNSCYIQSTGHFNAVEFLICYNQLAYSAFGHMFSSGAFEPGKATRLPQICQDHLARISLDQFFTHQLSSMLILKCATRFRNMIDAKDFTGTLSVERISHHKGSLFTETRCVFTDSNNGRAEGDILLCYLTKPLHAGVDATPRPGNEAHAHG